MMNAAAIFLVISSLAAVGVWSPTPEKQKQEHPRDLILKEGHRVIVVEYEKEGFHDYSDKVIEDSMKEISSVHKDKKPLGREIVEEAKEKFKEAASVLPNIGQGISIPVHKEKEPIQNTKQNICDAYGVCKEKIEGVFGKSKEIVTESGERGTEAAEGVVDGVKNAAEDAIDRMKHAGDIVANKTKWVGEETQEFAETMKNKTTITGERVKEVADNASVTAMEGRKNLTDILQRAGDVASDAFLYAISLETTVTLIGAVHLIAISISYGTSVWVTFISGDILAGALPKQQFGVVQSKIYPVYFWVLINGVGLTLLMQFARHGRRLIGRSSESFQGYILLSSLLFILINMLSLEPRATKLMFQRLKMEKEEGRGRDLADIVTESHTVTTANNGRNNTSSAGRVTEQEVIKSKLVELNQKLKNLNSFSSLLNIMTIVCLTWHLFYLSQRLNIAC